MTSSGAPGARRAPTAGSGWSSQAPTTTGCTPTGCPWGWRPCGPGPSRRAVETSRTSTSTCWTPESMYGTSMLTLDATASGPSLSYDWTSSLEHTDSGFFQDAQALPDTTWWSPPATAATQTATLTLTVTDGGENTAAASYVINVLSNARPTVSVSADKDRAGLGETVTLDGAVDDRETGLSGQTLRWTSTGAPGDLRRSHGSRHHLDRAGGGPRQRRRRPPIRRYADPRRDGRGGRDGQRREESYGIREQTPRGGGFGKLQPGQRWRDHTPDRERNRLRERPVHLLLGQRPRRRGVLRPHRPGHRLDRAAAWR